MCHGGACCPKLHFIIGVSSAIRWMQRFRQNGTCEPIPRGGSSSPLEKYAQQILAFINERPDLTLDEIVLALHKRRIPGSRSALSRFFARHGVTIKKALREVVWADSNPKHAQKNDLWGVRTKTFRLVRSQGSPRSRSSGRRLAYLPGVRGAAGRVPSVRQGEARASGVPGGQPALHQAICLLRRPDAAAALRSGMLPRS